MSDKKLESFKAGARHRPHVKQGGKTAKAPQEAAEAAPTLGFARIEAVLDHEDPRQVQKSLAELGRALDESGAKARGPKDRAEAKRARVAVERTTELLTYLFETKEQMLQSLAASADKGSNKAKRSGARKGDK